MTRADSAAAMPEITVPVKTTFAALVAGLLAGLALAGSGAAEQALDIARPIGSLWLDGLKMTIIPLVAGLLFTGIVQTVETASGGGTARRTLGLFAAVLVGSAVLGIIGTPALLALFPVPEGAGMALAGGAIEEGTQVPGFADFLGSLVPPNVLAAAAETAMLPFVVFISLFAFAATRLAEAQREPLVRLFGAIAAAMMVVIGWVLWLAPIGVFALALTLAIDAGATAIATLAHYIAIVVTVGAGVLIAAYALGVWAAGGTFASAMIPSQAVAISTQSSLASLPAMLASCRALGIDERNADFVLPLAVAIFRATSPAMNLAVAIYAARLMGVELSLAATIGAAAVALLISLSSVSLPGTISFIASVGPIALAMGVPLEPLAVLVAVEMIPDVMRTVANVTMNVAVTAAVDREG